MLTLEEMNKLRTLLESIPSKEQTIRNNQLDISQRKRDEKGRFLPNELELPIKEELELKSDRPKKIIKVEGSYNSYLIKDRWFTDSELDILYCLGGVIILAILF